MDDGKVNVMSPAMLEALEARLDSARAQARVTVLAGRRGVFSAGFDLKTLAQGAEAATTMMETGVNLLGGMLEHPHPIIALCTGHAYPMGAFLLLAADLRFGVAGDWRIGLNEVASMRTRQPNRGYGGHCARPSSAPASPELAPWLRSSTCRKARVRPRSSRKPTSSVAPRLALA